MKPDVYLVNMLPECAVSPILPYASKRADLKDRILAVYCGKSAAEWYSRYCQTVLRIASDRGIRAELLYWLRKHAMFPCDYCVVADALAPSRHAADLRVHGDKRVCKCCCDDSAANREAGECETLLPAWDSLTEFDPFAGLL